MPTLARSQTSLRARPRYRESAAGSGAAAAVARKAASFRTTTSGTAFPVAGPPTRSCDMERRSGSSSPHGIAKDDVGEVLDTLTQIVETKRKEDADEASGTCPPEPSDASESAMSTAQQTRVARHVRNSSGENIGPDCNSGLSEESFSASPDSTSNLRPQSRPLPLLRHDTLPTTVKKALTNPAANGPVSESGEVAAPGANNRRLSNLVNDNVVTSPGRSASPLTTTHEVLCERRSDSSTVAAPSRSDEKVGAAGSSSTQVVDPGRLPASAFVESVSLGASIEEADLRTSLKFHEPATEKEPQGSASGLAASEEKPGKPEVSNLLPLNTFGDSAKDDELAIDWCTGDRTVYCSSRCHCFAEILARHQQVDCNTTAVTAAKYLDNMCEPCQVKTASVLVAIRRFLRCVVFLQLKYRWRFTYRRCLLERRSFLGGCPHETYAHACAKTKGRCMRCEPFLAQMVQELRFGLSQLTATSVSDAFAASLLSTTSVKSTVSSSTLNSPAASRPSQSPSSGTRAYSTMRIRRKDVSGPANARKLLVERAVRLSYFLCSRCKIVAKGMLKQAAAKVPK